MSKKSTTEEFIIKAKNVHGDKYDYSKVVYTTSVEKVKIICPEHGEFLQKPNNHLSRHGCIKCSGKEKSTTKEFIIKAKNIHGNKYDYSEVKYVNNVVKVKIVCSEHGVFKQTPNSHLNGNGCQGCDPSKKLTEEEFIKKAKKTHNNRYDYSKVKYKNIRTKVKIICPDHGVFEQSSGDHLQGSGCLGCNSSKGEEAIRELLTTENILFEREKRFKELGRKRFDFYLPELNTIIEYDGKQHFKPVDYFGGEEAFKKTQESDRIKNEFCENNNINLLRIPYTEFNNIDNILLKEII